MRDTNVNGKIKKYFRKLITVGDRAVNTNFGYNFDFRVSVYR